VSNFIHFNQELRHYFADEVLGKVREVVGLRHQLILEEIGLILNRITVPNEQLVEVEETEIIG
jgi:hypothetical protein